MVTWRKHTSGTLVSVRNMNRPGMCTRIEKYQTVTGVGTGITPEKDHDLD